MSRFYKIGEASIFLGVSISTLRRWKKDGTLIPAKRTTGGTRYYSHEQVCSTKLESSNLTLA